MRYAVECNEQEFLTVANHYKWNAFIKSDLKEGNHVIYIYGDKAEGWDNCRKVRPNTIPYAAWALVKGITKLIQPNESLILTLSYTADINYNAEIVHVGCQEIPFSKVEALYKLITKNDK